MSLNDLSSRASLADVQADAVAFDASLGELVDMLDDVRDRGYIYGKDLDERLNDVLGKWEAVQDQVYGQIETRSQALYDAIYPLEDAIYDASFNPRTGTINKMERRVGQQLRNAGRAESEIERLYSDAESEAGRLRAELGRIDWMMDQLDEASFELEEDEHPVAAVRTIYDLPGKKDDYEGALFLTNKRLIYEQKEEKATKKVLFITTEKELVQEVQFDVAAADISAAKSKKKGLLGREDHLLVTASGARVEESDFHLKGQDSNMWVQLLTRVQRGDIEEDKATSAGISVRDLSGPVTQASIVELQTDVNELQSRAALTFAKNTLGDMEAMVGNLERDLQDVRAGGYLFESDLEAQVESLTSQWDKVRDDVNDEISTQEAKLSSLMQDMQIRLADVVGYADNPRAVEPQARALRSLVATANTQAEAAEEAVFAKYRAFQEDVEELGSRFEWVDWMLGALAQASFRLYPTEGGVAACDALYRRPNMDDQAGALFLTDQRLVFEEHEGDFSVMIEVAVSQIENVEAEDTRGEDKEEEHLIVSFDSAAPVQKADFVLLGPTNEEWQLLIGRSRQGDFVNDRAEKIDPAELERLKNAPTNCTACGAAFTEPLLRGQTEISCQFCFTVNRV